MNSEIEIENTDKDVEYQMYLRYWANTAIIPGKIKINCWKDDHCN
jgi:hypothetical protein